MSVHEVYTKRFCVALMYSTCMHLDHSVFKYIQYHCTVIYSYTTHMAYW